jgi:hypothetical protein
MDQINGVIEALKIETIICIEFYFNKAAIPDSLREAGFQEKKV